MRSLLIDDDKSLCELLGAYLIGAGFSVETAHSGRSGLQASLYKHYDIVLLDVMLPELDGFQVLAKLRRRSQVPVIMLTARGQESDRIRGLDSGADDYLAKPFSSRELVSRMRALLRRSQPGALTATLEIGDLRLRPGDNHVVIGDAEIRLTSVEAAALRRLCASPGTPVSRDELYRGVLKRESHPFDRSLDTHISNLRRKLGNYSTGRPRIIAVRGHGYQYSP
jgi:two-component system response regulator CpxR